VYVNDGIALTVIFLSIVVVVLAVTARNKAEQAISRLTLFTLLGLALALFITGILFLKMESEVIINDASNRIAGEKLQSQLAQIENSIRSLNDHQKEVEQQMIEKFERLNEARKQDRYRDRQVRDALSVLGSEIAWLKFLAVRDNGATEYLRTYSGSYFVGMEIAGFIPCSAPETSSADIHWTVHFQPDDTRRERLYQLVKGANEKSIPITFTGVLSPPGEYGHMGSAKHLFIVIDAQKRNTDSCEHPWIGDFYEPDAWPRINFRH